MSLPPWLRLPQQGHQRKGWLLRRACLTALTTASKASRRKRRASETTQMAITISWRVSPEDEPWAAGTTTTKTQPVKTRKPWAERFQVQRRRRRKKTVTAGCTASKHGQRWRAREDHNPAIPSMIPRSLPVTRGRRLCRLHLRLESGANAALAQEIVTHTPTHPHTHPDTHLWPEGSVGAGPAVRATTVHTLLVSVMNSIPT
jgi:hypothetical protein